MEEKDENLEKIWGETLAKQQQVSSQNSCFSIYRHIALLNSQGITIGDILNQYGINEVSIYGLGEIGTIVYNEIKDKVKVSHVYDRGKVGKTIETGKIENPIDIDRYSSEIIIITPGSGIQDISFSLISSGINRQRLVAIDTLLTMYLWGNRKKNLWNDCKQFLITGAQFHNKGAQAMLFTTVNELRKRFKDCIIWYLPVDYAGYYSKDIQKQYKMLFLLDGYFLESQLFAVVNGLDAIIDVSGYALSSYWDHEWYFVNMRIAKNYNIPMYLMPQSFGPFDYNDEKNEDNILLLSNMKRIYAREESGYALLTDKYKLNNVERSLDMVLANSNVDLSNIFWNVSNNFNEKLVTKNNVAIIPNVRLCEFSSLEHVLKLYRKIIGILLSNNKTVYLVPHSDDEILCKQIREMFIDNEKIILFDRDMTCVEFEYFIKNFDFAVASRFHSIVHALKSNVPCVSLGWAEKYREMMSIMNQLEYDVSIWDENHDIRICEAIELLMKNLSKAKDNINKDVANKRGSCFECLEELQ